MELRHLRYFAAVARELSFTRAAGSLRVAQPALSRQIKQLEEELGVPLFERNHRGVRLTESGRAFLDRARALLEQSEEAVLAARGAARPGRGTLNVGYVWGLFHSAAPMWIGRFRAQHPGCAVNLLDLTATQQAEALSQGKLDAGFIGLALEADGAGLSKQKVGACEFVAALPVGHRAARTRVISLSSLNSELFLMISDQNYPGAAQLVREACGAAGFQPRALQTAERGHTILSMISSGCGVAVLPEPLKALPHNGVVFRALEDGVRADLFLAWNPRREGPLLTRFLKQTGLSGGSGK